MRAELAESCTDEQQACENTGIGHVVANKGGQLFRMRLGDTSLAFYSCHLNAHEVGDCGPTTEPFSLARLRHVVADCGPTAGLSRACSTS